MGLSGTDNSADESGKVDNLDNAGGEDKTIIENDNKFLESLNVEYRDNPSLQTFTDINALAGSYINAQKMVGGNKMLVPTDNSSEEEWQSVFKKLGKPEDVEAYKGLLGKEANDIDEFDVQFAELADKNNLLPSQAKAMYKLFNEMEDATLDAEAVDADAREEAQVVIQKEKWGNAYDSNMKIASEAFSEVATPEQINAIVEQGLNNDPTLLDLFLSVGKKLQAEDTMHDGKANLASTPDEAQRKIDVIMDDDKHPYHNNAHSGHAAAMREVELLFKDLSANGPQVSSVMTDWV